MIETFKKYFRQLEFEPKTSSMYIYINLSI